jgi:hypothetical protein
MFPCYCFSHYLFLGGLVSSPGMKVMWDRPGCDIRGTHVLKLGELTRSHLEPEGKQ